MDWFKLASDHAVNEKLDRLSDGEFRALMAICGHAMRTENGGRVPEAAHRLIPRVNAARIRALEKHGFLHSNGTGWVIHDWEEHQEEALAIQEKKRRDAERQRAARAAKRAKGSTDA